VYTGINLFDADMLGYLEILFITFFDIRGPLSTKLPLGPYTIKWGIEEIL